MLSKIFNILKKKIKKQNLEEHEPPKIEQGVFLENSCAHILIEVDEEGNFVIGFDANNPSMESVGAIGNLLFLINSSSLSSFFIKSLKIWAEESEGQERQDRDTFVTLVLAQWNETYSEHEGLVEEFIQSQQKSDTESAIDPSRVFNLRKYL